MRTLITRFIALLFCLIQLSGTAAAPAKAPAFTLTGKNNEQISLTNYQGMVVYLDFWASWCEPCRQSFPWMNQMQTQYGKYGLRIIAINLDEDRTLADRFMDEVPASFNIAYDPKNEVAAQYQVSVMPSSYLIDKHGNLISTHRGFRSEDQGTMEQHIRQLLAQK